MPASGWQREALVTAGLGEKKVVIPNVECNWDEFKDVVTSESPKLLNCGGFEFMRCVANSKDLDVVSMGVAQSPELLKSVIGNGRVFVRPIQRDLELDEEYRESTEVTRSCYVHSTKQ